MATGSKSAGDELSTWQQIAEYLGVSDRTAQMWAKDRGLPVRKVGGRVSASTSELETWRRVQAENHPLGVGGEAGQGVRNKDQLGTVTAEQTGQSGTERDAAPETDSEPVRTHRWRPTWGIIVGFFIVALVSIGLVWIATHRTPEEPNSARMAGRVLTILGASGKTLWQYRFPSPLIEAVANPGQPACMFVDLDGDGALETLCPYRPINQGVHGNRLYCFDSRGQVRWTFEPGGTVRAGGHEYARPYFIGPFLPLPPDAAGHRRIVVSSVHNWSHPDQVAVLDRGGRLLSQYWHHGHLLHVALMDADGDGKTELVLGGLDDSPEYGRATLVVFSPERVSGSSLKANGTPDFDGMPPGSEQRVVLFSKTRISEDLEFNRVSGVRSTQPGLLFVAVAEGMEENTPYAVHELGRGLRPETLVFSNELKTAYRSLLGTYAGNRLIKQDTERLLGEVVVADGAVSAAAAVQRRAIRKTSVMGTRAFKN